MKALYNVAAHQKEYYRRLQEKLFRLVADHCEICGSTKKLEFDHPKGRDYDPTKLNQGSRYRRYLLDLKMGNLRTLCRRCNAKYKPVSD